MRPAKPVAGLVIVSHEVTAARPTRLLNGFTYIIVKLGGIPVKYSAILVVDGVGLVDSPDSETLGCPGVWH